MTLPFSGASISRGNGEFLSKDRHFDLTEHSRIPSANAFDNES
jgi:hypothetical protein